MLLNKRSKKAPGSPGQPLDLSVTRVPVFWVVVQFELSETTTEETADFR